MTMSPPKMPGAPVTEANAGPRRLVMVRPTHLQSGVAHAHVYPVQINYVGKYTYPDADPEPGLIDAGGVYLSEEVNRRLRKGIDIPFLLAAARPFEYKGTRMEGCKLVEPIRAEPTPADVLTYFSAQPSIDVRITSRGMQTLATTDLGAGQPQKHPLYTGVVRNALHPDKHRARFGELADYLLAPEQESLVDASRFMCRAVKFGDILPVYLSGLIMAETDKSIGLTPAFSPLIQYDDVAVQEGEPCDAAVWRTRQGALAVLGPEHRQVHVNVNGHFPERAGFVARITPTNLRDEPYTAAVNGSEETYVTPSPGLPFG